VPDEKLEIASVLFMDLVGFSRSSLETQRDSLNRLQEIVRSTGDYCSAEASGKLLKLPTGDGMALIFFSSDPLAPVRCAVQMQTALHAHSDLPLRIGIHTGPLMRHSDIRDEVNVVGSGINTAQRVMDCGDAGHILLSRQVAEVLHHTNEWAPCVRDLGTVTVKHGVELQIFNLIREDAGNPAVPVRFAQPAAAAKAPKKLSTGGLASSHAEANRYFEIALLSLIQYDFARMQKMLERALEIDPRFAEARAWFGFTHWLMIDSGLSYDSGLLYQAEAEFRGALQDDPDSATARLGMAAVFLFQGAKSLALAELRIALRTHPRHRDVLHQMLCCHWISGDYADMEAIALDLFERHPLFWPTRMDWGDALRSLGRVRDAIQEEEYVLEQDPRNPYARRFLARAQIAAGEFAAARSTLDLAPPEDRRGYWKIVSAILFAVEGKTGEALAEMDVEVLKYASFVLWYTAEVAVFYAVLGDASAAIEWLETAVRNGDERLEWFEREPLFDSLRTHPRFIEILESVSYRRHLRRTTPMSGVGVAG